jgi:CcmD family protein
MSKLLLRFFFFVFCLFTTFLVRAQDSLLKEKPQMADVMRSNGKIYVVVTVLMIIIAGLFIYLINLDRKLSRIEKNNS